MSRIRIKPAGEVVGRLNIVVGNEGLWSQKVDKLFFSSDIIVQPF